MNHVLCDGGLCNRLNALLFGLLLKQRYGGDWQISWPRNNWCDAAFEKLFTCELPHDENGLAYYRTHQAQHHLFMHEDQGGFDAAHATLNSSLTGWNDWQRVLSEGQRDGVSVVCLPSDTP